MIDSMERRCEYCMALRAVVLCESDAAHLCLSCDAKVHSANALSHRHPRTLVCDSCRSQPALVRCPDHQMFMCQSCDITHHDHAASLDHHKKKLVSCYVGCPSARDLADLWGFHFKPRSSLVSALYTQSGGLKVVNDDSQQNMSSSSFILQQIMDLEILQLSDDSFLAHVEDDATWREIRMLEIEMNNHLDATLLGKSEEPLPSPFPQLDSLTNTGYPLNGDAFWQFRRPVHTNEIWHQNMQDLGVCEEVQSFDDVKIPEVDVTFQSFEEVFGDVKKKKKQQQHRRVEV